MKKILFTSLIFLIVISVMAQQKEGKIIYQRTVQMQIVTNDGPGEEEHTMPRSRTDKFEMNFANGKMIWKQMEDEMQDDIMGGGGEGVFFRTMGGGADDAIFCDFEKARKVETREFFDKKFLIIDSIRLGNWKLNGETKTILNYVCRKASSQRIGKRMMMTMDNGKMERKEIDDTSTIVDLVYN